MPNQTNPDLSNESEPNSHSQTPDSLSRILLRRKGIVIGILALAFAVAGVYITIATKRYTSIAHLTVKLTNAPLPGDPVSDTSGGNLLATQQEVLTSSAVLAIVAQQPEIAALKATHTSATPIASLRKVLSVDVGKRDDSLVVSAETADPAEAPIIVKAVNDAYILYQTKPKESSLDNTLATLNKHREEANAVLTSVMVDMVELETNLGISPGSDQGNPIRTRMTDLEKSLDTADTDLLKAQSDFDAAKKILPPASSGAAAPADQTADLLAATMDETQIHDQLEQMQLTLADMEQRYLPNFPALKTYEQRVDKLERIYVAAIGRRVALAQARHDQIRQELGVQVDQYNTLNAETQHYKRLSHQADEQRHVIDQYDARIHDIELARDSGSVEITVLAPPGEATQTSPHKSLALGAALILGLIFGCSLAFVLDRLDDRLHTAGDVHSGLGVKLLGVVTQMPTGITPAVAAQKVALDPASEVAECYRTIRTALYFAAPKDRSKSILVTSPSPGDGKTTSAANLAIAMAQAGKRVVLVDADLRRPRQHLVFATRDRVGLATLLAGQTTLDQSIVATSIENLDLLPSGPCPRNPSELLNSGAFVELLETLSEQYDQVVIDSPPVLGLADARIVAASCDQTVLVLRAQKSTLKQSTLARDGLRGVGARLLGVIVNDVPRTKDEYTDRKYGYSATSKQPASKLRLQAGPPASRTLPPIR